mgnify:CR=1
MLRFQQSISPPNRRTKESTILYRWFPHPLGYALTTTGVNHGYISGYDRHGCCFERLPGGSAQRQPCYHVLDGLPYVRITCVSQGLECGSHAAAPAVLTIRRVVRRSPSWSRGCWMYS